MVSQPLPIHLLVGGYLLIFVSVVHLAYMGLVLGSSLLALVFDFYEFTSPDRRWRKFARYLAELPLRSFWASVLLGLVPVLTAIALYQQILFPADPGPQWPPLPHQLTTKMMSVGLVLLVPGLLLLYFYKWSFKVRRTHFLTHFLSGLAGNGLALLAYLFIISGMALALDPERWPYLSQYWQSTYDMRAWIMYSFSQISRFLTFQVSAMAITGAAILWDFYRSDWKIEDDAGYVSLVRNFGAGLALANVMALPVMMYWNLITLQYINMSVQLYNLFLIGLLILLVVSIWLFKTITNPQRKGSVWPLLGLLVFLVVYNVGEAMARDQALLDYNNVLNAAAQTKLQTLQTANASATGGAGQEKPGGAQAGQQLYTDKGCSACHSVDGSRRIGPSWKGLYGHTVTVLANGKPETVTADDAYIKESILQPGAQVVQGFPNVMPAQQLSDAEITALIDYIKTLK
ncbi:MAG: cytochrome c [Armatimonadetes bacterium]|nr:cytochrome c [Armatimonadota bacterium]